MAVKNDGLCMTYTINRLSETAKTFRRLGEAYECASGDEAQSPSFKRQLFLVADILEDCTLMQLQADKPSKGIARDMASRALVAGIVIKDVNILKDKTGRSEVVILARTLGKGCVAERKIRKIVCDVMGIGYYSDHNNRLVINDNCQQYVFHQENRFRFLSGVARKCKEKSGFNGDNFMVSSLSCGKLCGIQGRADWHDKIGGKGTGIKKYYGKRSSTWVHRNRHDGCTAGFRKRTASGTDTDEETGTDGRYRKCGMLPGR